MSYMASHGPHFDVIDRVPAFQTEVERDKELLEEASQAFQGLLWP